MSLHHIAKHLQEQGRGPDDQLVHMTSGELKSLQHLAEAHGGTLTINPKTGLPEAGFLSTVLPMAAGALAVATGQVEFLPLIAAGVGAVDYAMTGSLTQGLMAGLSAWGAGSLAGGVAELGAEGLAGVGAEAGNTAVADMAPDIVKQNLTAALPQGAEIGAESANQIKNITQAGEALKSGLITSEQYANLAQAYSGAYAPAAAGNALSAGLTSGGVGNYMANHLGQVAAVGLPLLAGAGNFMNNKPAAVPPGAQQQTNPFGLKQIPTDANGKPIFTGSFPAQPTPYKAQYPNYQQNPYNGYAVTQAADGGLMGDKSQPAGSPSGPIAPAQNTLDFASNMSYPGAHQTEPNFGHSLQMPTGGQSSLGAFDVQTNPLTGEALQSYAAGGVAKYAGDPDYGSMVRASESINEGLDMATRRKPVQMPAADVGIYHDTDSDTSKLDSYNATLKLLKKLGTHSNIPKGLKGLPEGGTLGAIATNTALEQAEEAAAAHKAKQSIAADPVAGMAEGGETPPPMPARGLPNPNAAAMGDLDAIIGASQVQGLQQLAGNGGFAPMQPMQRGIPMQGPAPMRTPEQLLMANNAYVNQALTPVAPTPQAAGYAIDPMKMEGSPAWTAEQARIAAEKAAWEAAHPYQSGNPYGDGGGGDGDGAGADGADGSGADGSGADGGGSGSGDGGGGDGGGGDARGGYYSRGNLHYHPGTANMALGGLSHLGSYSDGGRLLRGPGDGVSDSIPATIGGKHPARLAEGEFVIPARIVSEIGNGSTDAGAKRLYAMMDKIKAKRAKQKDIAKDSKAYKYLPT